MKSKQLIKSTQTSESSNNEDDEERPEWDWLKKK